MGKIISSSASGLEELRIILHWGEITGDRVLCSLPRKPGRSVWVNTVDCVSDICDEYFCLVFHVFSYVMCCTVLSKQNFFLGFYLSALIFLYAY